MAAGIVQPSGPGLAAVDPVARPVDVEEPGGGDLGEADRGDVAGLRAERPVHLLADALRLDRDVVEVRAPLQRGLALLGGGGPRAEVGQPSRRLELLGDLDEELQRGPGVGGDAVVRGEDLAELGGLDVDVDELPALGVGVQVVAGVAVRPAVADAEDEVGLQEGRVAVAVRGLDADHARAQLVVVGDGAPAHQGGDDRDAGELGELDEQVRGVGVDDAAAGDDQRALGLQQQPDGLLGLGAGRLRLVGRQRLVGLRVELDLGLLHVDRQVDEDRAGAAGAHQVEGLLEDAGDLGGLQDGRGRLGDRSRDGGDVDGLEVLLVELRDRRLAGDAEDRDRVGDGGVQAGDHVRAGGAGGADAHADVPALARV